MAGVKNERYVWAAIAVGLALLAWKVSGVFRPYVVEAGDSAPRFSIQTDGGRTITPNDFGGKLLVLHFWASWCPPCVAETPALNDFQKQFASDGVVVLGVSIDADPKAYSNFIRKYNVSFLTARDPDSALSYRYGTVQYPESYIIKDGRVVEKIPNTQDWSDPEFQSRVRRWLSS